MSFRLFVVSVLLVLAGCSGLPPKAVLPKFSVSGIEITSLGLLEQQFDVGLRLTNTNEFDLRVEAMEFDLEVNGREFAKGMSHAGMLVPAGSSAEVRVAAITQSKNLLEQFLTLSPEALKQGLPYRIKGRVKIDKLFGWMPFEYQGVVGGEEKKPKGIAI